MTETVNDRNKNDEYEEASPLFMALWRQSTLISNETTAFKEYIVDIRKGIEKQQEALNVKIEKFKEKYIGKSDKLLELWEEYESIQEPHYHYHQFYPATFNNSTLLSLYALFEFNLKDLCSIVQKCLALKIKLDDINGQDYIVKSKKYLELVVGIDLTDHDLVWKDIITIQQLRNRIVHDNSFIKKQTDPQSLYQKIKNNPNITLNENGTFIISNDQFLINAVDTIKEYLTSVINKLNTIK